MRVFNHIERVQHHLGKRLSLGDRSFRVRGFLANRLAIDFQHEPQFVELLRRLFAERAGAFIDIGTNVGQTLIKSLSVDPTRRYIGFEPQIDCCFYIDRFIKDNGLSMASILPLALSDTNGLLQLYSNSDRDEMASTLPGSAARSQWVAARIGDEVLDELGPSAISVIKIDVEGAELSVLRGLSKSLGRWRPSLVFEQLPNFVGERRTRIPSADAADNSRRAEAIADFLRDHAYQLFQITDQGREVEIDGFSLDDPVNYVGRDYLARPSAKGWAGRRPIRPGSSGP